MGGVQDVQVTKGATEGWRFTYPEGPSTQCSSFLVSNTFKGVASGTRHLKCCVLGPSGIGLRAMMVRLRLWLKFVLGLVGFRRPSGLLYDARRLCV